MNKIDIKEDWRWDELILLFDVFLEDPLLEKKDHIDRLLKDLKLLNLYTSRWKISAERTKDSVMEKLSDCANWELKKDYNSEQDSMFFGTFKADQVRFKKLANCIRIFLNHNLIFTDALENIHSTFEGASKEVIHFRRERDQRIIKAKKQRVLLEKNKLECEACLFNFTEKYGDRGDQFIEVHHTIPLSENDLGQITFIDDLVLLCSNCHRIIHRRRPWISLEDLKKIISEEIAA